MCTDHNVRTPPGIMTEMCASRSGCIKMLESFDFRRHYCLVFDLLGMSMYDFLR
jgi:hypothetical protein